MRPSASRRAALALVAALLLPAALTACEGAADDSARPSPSPSPQTDSPQKICFDLVTYWSKQVLVDAPNSGRDYMQKGLSNGQNYILLDAVAAARKERERHGLAAAEKLIDRQVKKKCDARYRNGQPTGHPWQAESESPTGTHSP
ncbi:hypothetical protein [Streptomyces sp. NBC_01304]|uniref:hypothetical protein n=1 Tax=Streptomyces sp. NBC_01304 TaxID=2903818 RepID=UPI002E1022AD|nr:hypothetical protein OG430_36075 [Streptomyces sp. NBC_01304]